MISSIPPARISYPDDLTRVEVPDADTSPGSYRPERLRDSSAPESSSSPPASYRPEQTSQREVSVMSDLRERIIEGINEYGMIMKKTFSQNDPRMQSRHSKECIRQFEANKAFKRLQMYLDQLIKYNSPHNASIELVGKLTRIRAEITMTNFRSEAHRQDLKDFVCQLLPSRSRTASGNYPAVQKDQ